MSKPQLQQPATADEARVLEIATIWEGLGDEALEEALTEVRELAVSPSVRYGYQREAQALAEVIDAQFEDVPAVDGSTA